MLEEKKMNSLFSDIRKQIEDNFGHLVSSFPVVGK